MSISDELFKEEEEPKNNLEGMYLVTCEASLVEGDAVTLQRYLVLCRDPENEIVLTTSPRLSTRIERATFIEDPAALAILREALLP